MPTPLNKDAVFISNDEVMKVSSMDAYIEVLEDAYAAFGKDLTYNMQRRSFWVPDEGQTKSLKLLAAATPVNNTLGAYVYSGGYRHKRGWQKCYILYDFTRGHLVAVIDCEQMSKIKTGAVSALATKYLSRENSKTAGIFGAGKQAITQLEGLSKVRQIENIKVFSRSEDARAQFCQQMTARLGIHVEPVATPRQVVAGSDIIITATTSKVPVFDGNWLETGTHVTAIGAHYPEKRELDEQSLRNHKVVVDTMDSFQECGEFKIPALKPEDIHADLGSVVAGKKSGRTNPEEITVFKSGGRGIEYLALASFVYQQVMGLTSL